MVSQFGPIFTVTVTGGPIRDTIKLTIAATEIEKKLKVNRYPELGTIPWTPIPYK